MQTKLTTAFSRNLFSCKLFFLLRDNYVPSFFLANSFSYGLGFVSLKSKHSFYSFDYWNEVKRINYVIYTKYFQLVSIETIKNCYDVSHNY
jgi:hypothetical protein